MFSNLLKFILGFLLAIAILIGTGVATALYFMNRTAIPPTKPIFANDHPSQRTQSPKATEAAATKTESQPKATPTPTPTPTTTETPKAEESPKPLPPGAYQGKVTWNQGLSLRAEPKQDAERVGGVGFNQKVIILEESDDKLWQKIRQEDTNQEGWVKAGNTEKLEGNEEVQQPEKPQQDQ
ncbi:SH3 type 3 domain-containing protein [Tolypothrix tenuis PCC 7101]|uniref:SH3 type 3 domain-containing protein n=1 Tax=Tolypothrix tenuis PCC 7101 TaxID=231146 RepID=A0A1Z4MRI0_9CYAN|nr:SH3 domain-containing protein [Aulosira sp. FACHB-113]BAY96105.1 SH3 type 3 domain-containing protein [Tolypothrix tenuis PCC 7101]BAZ73388.1 SH3 type 3 domain-containing protein [Aulosira laxa NIES-50]